jgi:hypothetical protein
VPCADALEELPEPVGWQSWPVVPELAGYHVVDLTPYQDPGCTSPRPHALVTPRFVAPGMCDERGADVKSWFVNWDSYRRSQEELAVHARPGTDVFVVAGVMDRWERHPDRPEYFVVAFRPTRDGVLGFVGRVVVPLGLAAALVFGALKFRGKSPAVPRG